MTTIILYRLSRLSTFARLAVMGGSASASGRLRVHRINVGFFYQPGMSHRSSIGPAEFQLIPRCAPPPNRKYFLRQGPSIYPPNQCP